MKIKKITNNSKGWHELKNPVTVMTNSGPKTCTRFYFNGFAPTLSVGVNDGTIINCTPNHKLMVGDEWVRADNLTVGSMFNNGLSVLFIENGPVLPTMDMEVPDEHYYILSNGIMSHNSSFILGQVSPSIEPLNSNYFVKDLAKGKFTYKNPELLKLLKSKNLNNAEVWKDILIHGGSVQHLSSLSDEEKAVYKTFGEISQKEIIIQAAQRQKYIDQGQSLNLMIAPKAKPKEVNELMIFAWELKVKGLYYQRSANPSQELARSITTCTTCEA